MIIFALAGIPALFAFFLTFDLQRDPLRFSSWAPFLSGALWALAGFALQWLFLRWVPVRYHGEGLFWNRYLNDFCIPWVFLLLGVLFRLLVLRRREGWDFFLFAHGCGYFTFFTLFGLVFQLPSFYTYQSLILPLVWSGSVVGLVFAVRLARRYAGWLRVALASGWLPLTLAFMVSAHLFRLNRRVYGLVVLLLLLCGSILAQVLFFKDPRERAALNPDPES